MHIRKGRPEDSDYLADFLIQAGKDIYIAFLKTSDVSAIKQFLKELAEIPGNQCSYHNWSVVEADGIPVGGMLVYKTGEPNAAREPIIEKIKAEFNPEFNAEKEAEPDEYYLDSLGVNPDYQGRGVGSMLLKHGIDVYCRQKGDPFGLLVDVTNPNAERLYARLGFEVVGKKTLADHRLKHMQVRP